MFFTTYFDFSELISLNNEKVLRFNLTFVQFSKLNSFTYTNLKNRIIFLSHNHRVTKHLDI